MTPVQNYRLALNHEAAVLLNKDKIRLLDEPVHEAD
jgi:hypothetical protein